MLPYAIRFKVAILLVVPAAIVIGGRLSMKTAVIGEG
jgi:hypothetical protein